MKYLIIAYNDDTTLGITCSGFNIDQGLLYTYSEEYAIKDVIPAHNVKIITQVSEEEFEMHRIDDDDLEDEEDGETEQGTVGISFPR